MSRTWERKRSVDYAKLRGSSPFDTKNVETSVWGDLPRSFFPQVFTDSCVCLEAACMLWGRVSCYCSKQFVQALVLRTDGFVGVKYPMEVVYPPCGPCRGRR